MVSNNGPVQNISDLDLACGRGAQSAQLDAQVAPGSVVSFAWVSGAGGNVRNPKLTTIFPISPPFSYRH